MESSLRPKARPDEGGYLDGLDGMTALDDLVIIRSDDDMEAAAAEACIGALEHRQDLLEYQEAEAAGTSMLTEQNSATEDGLVILRSDEPNYGAEAVRALNDSLDRNGKPLINPCLD